MPCRTYNEESALLGLALADARMPFAEPGTEPHYGPSRTVRIQHIDLSVRIFVAEKRFTGEARISVHLLPRFQERGGVVEFDLDDVTVDAVTDGDGSELSWSHDDDTLRVRGVTEDGVVVVRFHHQDPTRGLYFTGPEAWAPERQQMAWTQCQDEDAHFIFPCHDHPGTKHPWTLRLRADAGYTLLSNGRLVEQGEDDDGAWSVWEQADPMPAYLVNLVAARLVAEETEWRGRPVRYLVPEGEEEAVVRAFGKTPTMLEHYSQITGVEYAWPRYDQVVVHDFIFGGMENVACTSMTDLLLVDAAAAIEWDPDRLVCHELAHQWFGDLLTCQDWSQGWLNEAWATFMEVVWWEADREPADAAWYGYKQQQSYLGEDGGSYRRPIVSYRFREPIDVFDRHLYEKGACVMRTLRTELGAEAFWAGARLYLERHRHSTVHSRHFQRAMEDASGRNLDRFFDQWIFGAGHPDVKLKMRASDGLLTLTVQQTQTPATGDAPVAEAFHFPLALEIVFDDGSTRKLTLPVKERERTWAVPVEQDVATVRVDPGNTILAVIKLDAPRGWLERIATDACPVLSVRAIQGLLDEGSGKSTAAALQAFHDHPAWQTRAHIAEKLGKRGGDTNRDALLARFEQDQDPRVRRACASALGNWRDKVVADALINEIEKSDPTTPHLRAAALRSLGKTRDDRAIDVIRPHLDVESWADMISAGASKGLAWTEDASVIEDLIQRSRPDHRPRVRSGAAAALGILGDRVESTRQAVVDRLVEMLTEPGFREGLTAINALARLRDPRAIPALSDVHASAPDGRTRRMAYVALYRIRQGRTTEAGLASLRAQVEKLADENADLRGRIDKLEQVED